MARTPNPLIDRLADDLEPVRVMKTRDGLLLVALAVLATVLLVMWFHGLWMTGLTGGGAPIYYIANGLILLVGLASTTSVIALARPHVGSQHDGPRWAMAMLGVIPLVAIVTLSLKAQLGTEVSDPIGLKCFTNSILASGLTLVALVLWLRRGAPVSLQTAGLQTGVAAGALGSVAYGLTCPLDTLGHIGIFHIAPIALSGLVGRFVVPKLVRW